MGGTVVNFAGVYGAETTTIPSFTNYSGTYAGSFTQDSGSIFLSR